MERVDWGLSNRFGGWKRRDEGGAKRLVGGIEDSWIGGRLVGEREGAFARELRALKPIFSIDGRSFILAWELLMYCLLWFTFDQCSSSNIFFHSMIGT